MIVETMENGVYTSVSDGEVLCTITSLGNSLYRAVNRFTDITAEVIPLDEYRTQTRCIENKRVGKDGRYRKTKTLAEHNTSWLAYMLQEKGFIRKAKPIKQ